MSVRSEQQVFDDLAKLCTSPGYAHAIAYFCFRDHLVSYGDALKKEDYAKLCTPDRLIRTEITTLIGLMVRAPRNLVMPEMQTLQCYLEQTEALLEELQQILRQPAASSLVKAIEAHAKGEEANPFADANVLREPIFYSSESAFSFQYRDLSVEKYALDQDWFTQHKGFKPSDARAVAMALCEFLPKKLMDRLKQLPGLSPEKWSILEGFQFTVRDISARAGLPDETVQAVVDAFSCRDDANRNFTSLGDFNAVNGSPILREENGIYTLFLYVGITEALYDTPFYWMIDDDGYKNIASTHRGVFTENFTARRLTHVFGKGNVLCNVDVWETSARKKKLGEIDVLVIFGDRAIVVQAKSKRLTLEARKGNDLQLKADFKDAVQVAYEQAANCARELIDGKAFITDSAGKVVGLPSALKSVHPLCVVSDHYPALSFQALQFLSFEQSEVLRPPLVCDVFFIDVVTEFLETPLRLLSYLELRARAADKIALSHEIVALGYHLSQNLWLGKFDYMLVTDDVATDISIAMAARRDGIKGEKTPPGVLTHLKGTAVGRIIEEIERRPDPGAIGIGLELLKLGGRSVKRLCQMIDKITRDASEDGEPHNATVFSEEERVGITLHCNELPDEDSVSILGDYCERRKYKQKADRWFGLSLRPGDGGLRLGLMLDEPWKQDDVMDAEVRHMLPLQPADALHRMQDGARLAKVGRNEPCPCGSGLKYKKCHLLK